MSTADATHSVRPPALRPGNEVAVVCPSGRPNGPRTVARAVQLISEMGFRATPGKHVLSSFGPMAGTDEERAEDLNRAIASESIRAVFCLTGGFGSLRILNHIDYDLLKENPKIVAGCGDNSSLLLAINKLTDLTVFHAPNLDQIRSRYTFNSFKNCLTSTVAPPPLRSTDEADDIFSTASYATAETSATGTILGGNLTGLTSLWGTRFQPMLKDVLLCIEDVNEFHGALDRWFTTLFLGGHLKELGAIAFGTFENCGAKGAENSLSFEEMAFDLLKNLRTPACFGLKFGQTQNTNVVPIGIRGRLDCKTGELHYLEPALS